MVMVFGKVSIDKIDSTLDDNTKGGFRAMNSGDLEMLKQSVGVAWQTRQNSDRLFSALLALPCRESFTHGQLKIQVEGPFDLLEALLVHTGFWDI
jgi:hypothetical protein